MYTSKIYFIMKSSIIFVKGFMCVCNVNIFHLAELKMLPKQNHFRELCKKMIFT